MEMSANINAVKTAYFGGGQVLAGQKPGTG
jgi:hypothetical protein